MISELGHGSNTQILSDLYEAILEDGNKNICSQSCRLPLSSIKRTVTNGKCNQLVTTEFLCKENETTTTRTAIRNRPIPTLPPPITPQRNHKNTTTSKPWIIGMLSSSGSTNNKCYLIFLSIIIKIYFTFC